VAKHRRRRSWRLLALRLVLAALAVGAGVVALVAPPGGPGPGVAASDRTASPAPGVAVRAAQSRSAVPVRVQVPSVGIDSGLARLGLDAAGALVPPADFGQAGWLAESAAPGDVGPAVLAGHVDSSGGPAVFYRLRETAVGDDVLVGRGDGTTARFTVTRVDRYPKADFPTAEVYGPTPDAELRLITCGGDFDHSRRSYVDNVVVYARLVT
jgi:hypothetical protein